MTVVKIRTMKGRIITLTVHLKNDTHYLGTDKFGEQVKIPIKDIDSLFTVGEIEK